MKVHLQMVVPTLPEAIGGKELEVEFAGKTVNDLLDYLLAHYGQKARQALYDVKGELDPVIQVLLNGKEWVPHDQLDTMLHDGDSVAFLAMIAGG